MRKYVVYFARFQRFIKHHIERYMEKVTNEFIESYEEHNNEKPSDRRVKRFRKEMMLKNILTAIVVIFIIYIVAIN